VSSRPQHDTRPARVRAQVWWSPPRISTTRPGTSICRTTCSRTGAGPSPTCWDHASQHRTTPWSSRAQSSTPLAETDTHSPASTRVHPSASERTSRCRWSRHQTCPSVSQRQLCAVLLMAIARTLCSIRCGPTSKLPTAYRPQHHALSFDVLRHPAPPPTSSSTRTGRKPREVQDEGGRSEPSKPVGAAGTGGGTRGAARSELGGWVGGGPSLDGGDACVRSLDGGSSPHPQTGATTQQNNKRNHRCWRETSVTGCTCSAWHGDGEVDVHDVEPRRPRVLGGVRTRGGSSTLLRDEAGGGGDSTITS
jgi:hypothetical protein